MACVPTGTLAQPTVQRGQLLRPYPQFTNLTLEGYPIGHSIYHSFQTQFNKRFSTSLIGVAYTISKGIGNTESRSDWLEGGAQNASMRFLNNNNRTLDRSLNLFDSPQRLVVSYSLDLPFGQGQPFLTSPGVAGFIISGWQFSGIYTAQSGTPLGLEAINNLTGTFGGGSRPNNNGTSAKLTGKASERLNRWFDTSVFSQPPAFQYGTTGRTLPDTRHHGTTTSTSVSLRTTVSAETGASTSSSAPSFSMRSTMCDSDNANMSFGIRASASSAVRAIPRATSSWL